jgi:hypothetical protein
MHWVDKQMFRKLKRELSDCFADSIEAIAEILAPISGY